MAASIPISTYKSELQSIQTSHPSSIDELQVKVDSLFKLVRAHEETFRETDIPTTILEIKENIQQLKEKQLKSLGDITDKGEFSKACIEVEHLFSAITKFNEQTENRVTDSFIKIILLSSSTGNLTKIEKEQIFECLPLLTTEQNQFRLADALVDIYPDDLQRNFPKFKLSEDHRFSIAMKIIKKIDPDLENGFFKFSDKLKTFSIAKIIAQLYPDTFWLKHIEKSYGRSGSAIDPEKLYMGINDKKQLFELMKITLQQPNCASFLNQTHRIFGDDIEIIFMLAKNISKQEQTSNPLEFFSPLTLAYEITQGKKVSREILFDLALNLSEFGGLDEAFLSLLTDNEIIKLLHNFASKNITKLRINILINRNYIFNQLEKRKNIKKEFYQELIEITRTIFSKQPREISTCIEWLKFEDFISLAKEALAKNESAIAPELFKAMSELSSEDIKKELYPFIISALALVKTPDIYYKFNEIMKLLNPDDSISFISKAVKYNNVLEMGALDRLIGDPKVFKEYYSELLDIAKIEVSRNPESIKYCDWLNSKDYWELTKVAVTKSGITIGSMIDHIKAEKIVIKDKETLAKLEEIATLAVTEDIRVFALLKKYEEILGINIEKFEKIVLDPKIFRPSIRRNIQKYAIQWDSFLRSLVHKGESEETSFKRLTPIFVEYSLKLAQVKTEDLTRDDIPIQDEELFDFCKYAARNGCYIGSILDPTRHTLNQLAELKLITFEQAGGQFYQDPSLIRYILYIENLCRTLDIEVPIEDSSIDTDYRGLLLMRDPEATFMKMQKMGLKKDDPLFILMAPIIKEIESLPEKDRSEALEGYNTVLRWIGYFDLKSHLTGLPKDLLIKNMPAISQIMKLQYPKIRYDLSSIFFDQMGALGHATKEGESKLEKETSYKDLDLSKTDDLYKMLLKSFIPHVDRDWRTAEKILSMSKLQSGSAQNIVLNCLSTILQNGDYSIEEKGEFIHSLFEQLKDKGADEVLTVFREVQALFSINENAYLEKLLAAGFGSGNFKGNVEELLTQLFCEKLEISTEEGVKKEFGAMIAQARQPTAIFTYFAKLQKLEKQDRESSVKKLKELMNDVMNGNYTSARYQTENNPHLKELFEILGTKKELWIKGSSATVEKLLKDKDMIGKESHQRSVSGELHTRVCVDNHFNFLDESPTKPSILKRFLQKSHDATALKKELNTEMGIVVKNISELEKKGEDSTKEKIVQEKLRIQSWIIESLEKGTTEPFDKAIRKLSEDFAKLGAEFPEKDQVIADLNMCKKITEEIGKPIKKQDLSKFTVVDTDDWEDLLLCGTEVLGSCQHIDRDPYFNKCLLGYVTDGKIRMIAVKDATGKIVARRILRLLVDSENKPVLYQERLYSNLGVPEEAIRALDAMTIQKAKAMEITLVTTKGLEEAERVSEEESKEEVATGYPFTIMSKYSPAPFEYVDAGGKGITDGSYELPSGVATIMWQKKIKKKSSFEAEINHLRKQLQM